MWNWTFIHPEQDRLISIREWARLQSFPDNFVFYWSKGSQYKEIWNAVPPLLWRAIAELIKPYVENKSFVDLFAWAWWISLWFEMEWFHSEWCIELVEHYYETYVKNKKSFLDSFICGDITQEEVRLSLVEKVRDKKIWVIIWWPPCQGFSLAWLRNPDDPRNKLFMDYVKIVEKIKPEMFIMENVPGILSMQWGKVIEAILKSFRDIWYYVNEPMILNAEEYWVPQRRRRVIIIWSLKNIKVGKPKILFSETNSSLPKPITVKEAIWNLSILKAWEWTVELEVDDDEKNSSDYELLMMGKIDFNEFYSRKLRSIS